MNAPDIGKIVGAPKTPRLDHVLITEMVEAGSRVLDVGCGDGELLQLLTERKGVDGRGVELQRDKVNACVARGLSVIQGDADRDLDNYPDQAFDYAILSLTIQATRQPKTVLENLLRIGRRAIVSFPNFGHWQVRTKLLFTGRMPVNDNLPDRRTRICARSAILQISVRWCMPMSNRPSRSTPTAPGCRSGGHCRCKTCSAKRPCSCCAGLRDLQP